MTDLACMLPLASISKKLGAYDASAPETIISKAEEIAPQIRCAVQAAIEQNNNNSKFLDILGNIFDGAAMFPLGPAYRLDYAVQKKRTETEARTDIWNATGDYLRLAIADWMLRTPARIILTHEERASMRLKTLSPEIITSAGLEYLLQKSELLGIDRPSEKAPENNNL